MSRHWRWLVRLIDHLTGRDRPNHPTHVLVRELEARASRNDARLDLLSLELAAARERVLHERAAHHPDGRGAELNHDV